MLCVPMHIERRGVDEGDQRSVVLQAKRKEGRKTDRATSAKSSQQKASFLKEGVCSSCKNRFLTAIDGFTQREMYRHSCFVLFNETRKGRLKNDDRLPTHKGLERKG